MALKKIRRIRRSVDRVRSPMEILETPDNCLTKQEFKTECDMNVIVRRAMKGIPPAWTNPNSPQYGDFSNTPSLTEAYELIENAQEAFMNLPDELRRELDNDPRNISELTQDQISRYGLGKAPKKEAEAVPPPHQESEGGRPSKNEPEKGVKNTESVK